MDARLPLARGHLDPMVHLRPTLDPVALVDGRSHVRGATQVSLFFLSHSGELLLERSDATAPEEMQGQVRLKRVRREEWITENQQPDLLLLALGLTQDGTFHIAACSDHWDPHDGVFAPLRQNGHLLDDDDAALATTACALIAWHRSSEYCQCCGECTGVAHAGWVRTCLSCAHVEYPRQDPAVIVLVLDEDDRVLLAHAVSWEPSRMSLLAGFVDAGESPEKAVEREVREEVGIDVEHVEYVASQPWPFPRSLMMGFRARVRRGSSHVPVPDGVEIDRARFFSREEFAERVDSGHLSLPTGASIARAMLDNWFAHSC